MPNLLAVYSSTEVKIQVMEISLHKALPVEQGERPQPGLGKGDMQQTSAKSCQVVWKVGIAKWSSSDCFTVTVFVYSKLVWEKKTMPIKKP